MDMAETKRIKIQLFVSYAHADDAYSKAFIEEFREMCAPSKRYEYVFWQDTGILPGEKWKEAILDALRNCDLGLLLISPAFLGSKFIEAEELPGFVGEKAKPIIPVMLKKVSFQRHNLKGLEVDQIFGLKVKRSEERKSFAQCGSRQRSDFVYELYDQVEARLDKIYG
jgi:hypothetical protein